jgi:hypothetical protein
VKVSREELLSLLDGVSPGLSNKDLIEQATCFAFLGGKVHSYNDETYCVASHKFGKEFQGAVPAKPLLELLRKLPDDEIDVAMGEGGLTIKGKGGRKGEIRCEAEVLLAIDKLERPKTWTPLAEDFAEAVDLVQSCCSRDGEISQVCIHVHKNWVEACDDVQLCRYNLKTGVKQAVLLRRESVRHIVTLGMTEFAEGQSWFHFRNPDKLQLSCRRYLEDYPDWTEFLKVDGERLDLPKGLKETLERSVIFLDEPEEDARRVRVELMPGKFRVIGEGVHGKWSEPKKTNYAGRAMSFRASPTMLAEISQKHNSCEATEDRLKVDGGKWRFIACLDKVESNGHAKDEGESTGEE